MRSIALVDEYFIENRTRVLEIAAYLDRLDRAGSGHASEFRMKAFGEALGILADSAGNRVERIQMILSDPTTEPTEQIDSKSAVGVYDRWSREAGG